MLLEMASLEGRDSLCVASLGTGEAKTRWTQPQCKLHERAPETPVHWVMGNVSLRFWGPLVQMHRLLQDYQPLQDSFGSLSCPPAVKASAWYTVGSHG